MCWTRSPCILASASFCSTLKAVLYFLSVGAGSSAGHWPRRTIPHSGRAAQGRLGGKRRGTQGGSLPGGAQGPVTSGAEDSRGARQASHTAPIIPASQGRLTSWGESPFAAAAGPRLPKAPSSRGPGSLLRPEASSATPDFVVLAFLSKHRNKMPLFKEPAQGWREELREGLRVAESQGRKEE